MCHKVQTRINLVFEIILKDENQNIFSTYLVHHVQYTYAHRQKKISTHNLLKSIFLFTKLTCTSTLANFV